MGKHKKSPLEIRNNKDGSLDEIVCSDAFVHLEQMSDNNWWMAIEWQGKLFHVNFSSASAITCIVEEE